MGSAPLFNSAPVHATALTYTSVFDIFWAELRQSGHLEAIFGVQTVEFG